MRHRSVQTRAGSLTAAAVLAGALVGFGIQSSADASFSLDVRLSSTQASGVTVSGGTATLGSGFSTGNVNLEVWGVVTGTDAVANEGLQDAFFGVGSSKGATTATTGDLSVVSLAAPWTGTVVVSGSTYSTGGNGSLYTNADGNKNVGSTNSGAPDNWVFARSTSMTTTGGTTSGNPSSTAWLLGTLTYNVTAKGTAGTTTIAAIPRASGTNIFPAVWQQDTQEADGAASVGQTVTIAAAVPPIGHIAGNTSFHNYDHDDSANESVGAQDLINVLNNLGTTNAVGYAWPRSTTTAAVGNVGAQDLINVLNNLGTSQPTAPLIGGTPETSGIAVGALAAVPEPTSLGLLGLGAVAAVRRRRAR